MPSLTKDENIQLRQGTAMGQRSLQGFKETLEAGRIVSLEHLLNSLIWETFEARELLDDARVYIACYSSCCYGGWRTKCMCLITNDEGIVRAVDRPHCPGHWWLRPYQVHETEQGLRFDTKEAAEYPWDFCTAYAAGVRVAMDRRNPSACGLGGA